MPTYDYKCNACGHTFEHFQSMKDKPLKKCPACERRSLERLIGTGAAIMFKGSGFYETDYRSDSYKKAAAADKSAASGSDPAPATTAGTETKPDTKASAQSAANPDPGPATKPAAKSATKPATDSGARGESTGAKPKDKPSRSRH